MRDRYFILSCVLSHRKLLSALCSLLMLQAVSGDWIDTDTPLDKRTVRSVVDGTEYQLVMSDEFNVENRTFKDGHDPMWTALDKSDDDASSAGGGSMQFYNSTAVTTENGFLKISTYLDKTEWNRYDHVDKVWKHQVTNFTSGMMQSWNKFCFTGGIVEVDVIFPGDPFVGGLWPAVWMLGNLGRATYEASTNNIWPWSYNTCNRELQQAQSFSACNSQNHFGMHPHQGRGATEIDIVEVMTGDSNGPLPSTDPPVSLPYADLTLQVAPGVPKNRPQSGSLPLRKSIISKTGHTEFQAQTWYRGLEMHGNTSINPFFYGTYLGETRPFEPVTRTKEQAFQADAVGAAHQLAPDHFKNPHTFRMEWQPGNEGRIDWFVKGYRVNSTTMMVGDGKGTEWLHAFSLKDKSLKDLMGSQIPNEPSYLIMNTAVSSTWGFPYDTPEWCTKCYDCNDPKCACSFYPGFCAMLENKVSLLIDSIRVYQTTNHSVHVGSKHTVGCDPPEYPTREWIEGHEYRYMRNPPFSYKDKKPLRQVQRGGGACESDRDCGAHVHNPNLTAIYEQTVATGRRVESSGNSSQGRGKCTLGLKRAMFSTVVPGYVCSCHEGFTGPHCLALDYFDTSPSAKELRSRESPFRRIERFEVPVFFLAVVVLMIAIFFSFVVARVLEEKRTRAPKSEAEKWKRPVFEATTEQSHQTIITGTSI